MSDSTPTTTTTITIERGGARYTYEHKAVLFGVENSRESHSTGQTVQDIDFRPNALRQLASDIRCALARLDQDQAVIVATLALGGRPPHANGDAPRVAVREEPILWLRHVDDPHPSDLYCPVCNGAWMAAGSLTAGSPCPRCAQTDRAPDPTNPEPKP